MSRVFGILAFGVALAGCTASGDLMKTATPTVPLQFESDPPGAEVKTSGGQSCRTPCALAVPAADMQATYALTGFQPQTVAVKLMPPDDIRGSEESGVVSNTPRFSPSPVFAELTRAAPKRSAPAKKRAPRVAQQPAPPTEQPLDRNFPAPPPSTSGFNPPPPSNSGFGAPPQQRPAPPSSSWPAPAR